MLDYLNKEKLTEPIILEEEDIAEIMETNITGTHFQNIENVNSITKASKPSLEFIAEYEPHKLADIKKQIETGLPVAVWITTNDGSGEYAHSVVITGIDDSKKEISYNDPTYGNEVTISQSKFLDMWDYWGSVMIKAEIGRITTESIEKYFKDEGKI